MERKRNTRSHRNQAGYRRAWKALIFGDSQGRNGWLLVGPGSPTIQTQEEKWEPDIVAHTYNPKIWEKRQED